jgi:excisionase family DNA binding protein
LSSKTYQELKKSLKDGISHSCKHLPGMAAVEERWLSVDEISIHLGVSRDTVYKWISRKGLPGHKVGKLWKFSTREVDDWVRSGGTVDARARGEDSTGGDSGS